MVGYFLPMQHFEILSAYFVSAVNAFIGTVCVVV
jgi:hypothetical protein